MAKLVNLNKFRKKKARADKTRKAAENRIRHGRTLAQRTTDALENARTARMVDGAKRTGPATPWSVAPDVPPTDPYWQIGAGESVRTRWQAWVKALRQEDRRTYIQGLQPIPAMWQDPVAQLQETPEDDAEGDVGSSDNPR